MSLNKLLHFLNRPELDVKMIDLGFETQGQDIGTELATRLLEAKPSQGYKTENDILSVRGIGPKRLKLMLQAASLGKLDNMDGPTEDVPEQDTSLHIDDFEFIPSFRSHVPLGMNEQMWSLVEHGTAALPTITRLLKKSQAAQVRKAAVVMLAYIDSPKAEKHVVAALADPETRAEALVVLSNYYMRDPNGSRAYEANFLYDPDTALRHILPLIENNETAYINSGYPIFQGPVSHLALAAAARIHGTHHFINVLPQSMLMRIGIEAVMLNNLTYEVLLGFFGPLLDAIRSALGITDDGVITPTTKDDVFTLSFTCNKDCNCDKIAWIQICKATLPGGDVGYTAGEKVRDTDSDGRLVDRLNGRTNPVYGSGNDAAGTIPASSGQYGNSGKPPTPAKLSDKPGGPVGTVFEFESCVFCIAGKDAGTCYGCYKWTCTIDKDGDPKYEVKGSADKPSADFKKAAKEWNAVAGKKDTPDPDKW